MLGFFVLKEPSCIVKCPKYLNIDSNFCYKYIKKRMNEESNPIDLPRLKELIHNGVEAIPVDKENNEAIIVIGDTGVGKSTIMSFLSGS